MPLAPSDACGRSTSTPRGASERSARKRFTAAARSDAVSASVPSRSKSTARTGSGRASFALDIAAERCDVIDRRIGFEPVRLGERVIGHPDQIVGFKAGAPAESGQLGRFDKTRVVVRAAWQESQDVFAANDGK